MARKLISIPKAAQIIGMTPNGVRNAIRRGRLTATIVKIPRLMLDLSQVKDYKPNEQKREIARVGGQALKESYPDTVLAP